MGSILSRIKRAPFMASGWRELASACSLSSNVAAAWAVASGAVTWQELASVVSVPSLVAAGLSLAQWQEIAAAASIPSGVAQAFSLTQWQEMAAAVSIPSAVAVAMPQATPFFVQSTLSDSSAGGLNAIFAADSTNAEITSRSCCSDPVTGDNYQVFYNNAAAVFVVSKQAGGVGDWAHTVSTATAVAVTDNHLTISCIVDDTSRLCVWGGFHSNQEIYWRAPNPGDTLITNATKISPRVPGGGAIEANATYPDPVRKANGTVLHGWRRGGSGAGSEVVDKLTGGVWTRVNATALDGEGTRSFYQNNLCIEGAFSAVPGRFWRSFQCRETIGASSAHGLWCMYSDDDGATWYSWNGTLIGTSPKLADLGPANVEAIPSAETDSAYSYYYGIQGMAVGLDGVPIITMQYGPATAPSGGNYGTQTGPLTIYAWRCDPVTGVVTKQAIKSFPNDGTYLGASRPKPLVKGGKLMCFYSAIKSSDPALTGRLYCTSADAATLTNIQEQEVFQRNGIYNPYCASFCFDSTALDGGRGPIKYNALKVGLTGFSSPGSSPAAYGVIDTLSVQPVVMNPVENFGSGNLDFWYNAHLGAVDDGAGFCGQLVDLSGNTGRDAVQATSSKRPLIVTNALNGRKSILFDGIDDFLNMILARSAPTAGTPYTIRFVGRQRSGSPGWVTGKRLFNMNGAILFATGASPTVRQNHGTSSNQITTWSLDTYKRGRLFFNGGTGDFAHIGSTFVGTTPNSGATISGTQVTLGADASGGSGFANWELLEIYAFRGVMTAAKFYNDEGYINAQYGAGLT